LNIEHTTEPIVLARQEIVEVLRYVPQSRTMTVLVRAAGSDDSHSVPIEEIEASVTIGEADEAETEITCAGKDGECSRTVDSEGERCWQHPEDEEEA
jgi:hypothetical protein